MIDVAQDLYLALLVCHLDTIHAVEQYWAGWMPRRGKRRCCLSHPEMLNMQPLKGNETRDKYPI
jgi:hypothetical protein